MKKADKAIRIRIVAVVVLAAILLLVFIGTKISLSIKFPAFYSGRKIEIPLITSKYNAYDNFVEFKSGKSPEQISKAILRWDSGATVKVQENSIFVSSVNPDTGKQDYYYIYKPDLSDNKIYRINDMISRYTPNEESAGDNELSLLIPAYLLLYVQDGWVDDGFHMNPGERYEMVETATIEEVYDFYIASGYYETEYEGEQIILKYRRPDSETDKPIEVMISRYDQKIYFSYIIRDSQTENVLSEPYLSVDIPNVVHEQEEKPAISREAAMEQMLNIINKTSDQIEFSEVLNNLQGIPAYEMFVFSSGGYAICMLDYAVVVEFSDDGRTRPYAGAEGRQKYYAGPANYLYEEDGTIFLDEENRKAVQINDYLSAENRILEYAKSTGNPITDDKGGTDGLIADEITETESGEPEIRE